jgi:hypothetical protein
MRKTRRFHIFLLALGLAVLANGCGSITSSKTGLNVVAAVSSQSAEGLTFKIGVENTGSGTETLSFTSGQFCEIEVRDRLGRLVWNLSHDAYFVTMLWGLEIAPGETQFKELVWDLVANDGTRVPFGSYTARITVTSTPKNEDLSTGLGFTL